MTIRQTPVIQQITFPYYLKHYRIITFHILFANSLEENKTLDWIVTDKPNKAVSSSVFPPIGNSAHHIIFARLSLYHSTKRMHETPHYSRKTLLMYTVKI